jgi:two-component system, chemotaxis family, protein-glutamate methylesterase/glutaminase
MDARVKEWENGKGAAAVFALSHSPTQPKGAPQVLAIAASTGGPAAVQALLSGLGAGFPLPILVVQHIARGFVGALAEWLGSTLPYQVRVAQAGERLLAGHVYLAPEDQHLLARVAGFAGLRPHEAGDRYCPGADVLFDSVATAYSQRAIGVVLTGMGDDGARGLCRLRAAGSQTLGQDEASCVVYGMPKAAVAAGAVAQVAPLTGLADTIWQYVHATG